MTHLNKHSFFILIFTLFLFSINGQSQNTNSLNLNGDIPWVVSKEDYKNPAIKKAIRDVEKDWYKVFGIPPVIFKDKIPNRWHGPVIAFGSVANSKPFTNTSKVPRGKEQHALFFSQRNKNLVFSAIGDDTRGTIFAIYTFSKDILGIDPMYIFTDNKPTKRTKIPISSKDEFISKKPTFENRGWFINDEELHDGMHRDPLGGNVISMEWMDKIIESILRCKGNMLIPESAPYPDATVYDLCKRRGIVITHHHVTPVGLNMMDWPKDVPFSYITHKDILVDAWTKAIKAQADKEVAWVVGFRGESDGAFWNSDPAAPKEDSERAAVIADAMQTQTDLIHKVSPNATIVAALWNEQARFYNRGLLKIPNGVSKMFSDDGRGFMRDEGGKNIGQGDGFYYHVMMMMNTQNRTTEGVPPARFYKELKRYVEKDATKYAIINVSGIRPAVMSVEAITDFLWDATPALNKAPEDAMKDYLDKWHAKEFGDKVAEKLTDLRLHYYNIPYMREKMPVSNGRWRGARGEHLVQHTISDLLKKNEKIIIKGQDLNTDKKFNQDFINSKTVLVETEDFFPGLWKKVKSLEKEIPEDRKDFYQAHFTYQVAVHMYSCKALQIVNDAFDDYLKNKNPQKFVDKLKPALDEIEAIINEAHKAEYGKWDTMFLHVRLMDFWKNRLRIKALIAKVEGKDFTDKYRGYHGGSFWGSAQEYMDYKEGVFPYFYKSSGKGLDYLENKK